MRGASTNRWGVYWSSHFPQVPPSVAITGRSSSSQAALCALLLHGGGKGQACSTTACVVVAAVASRLAPARPAESSVTTCALREALPPPERHSQTAAPAEAGVESSGSANPSTVTCFGC